MNRKQERSISVGNSDTSVPWKDFAPLRRLRSLEWRTRWAVLSHRATLLTRAELHQDGTGAACARLFLTRPDLGAVEQGPHQHSLTIAGRHDKHRVDAIVRLFDTLSYFVELSTTYGGADS